MSLVDVLKLINYKINESLKDLFCAVQVKEALEAFSIPIYVIETIFFSAINY